MLIGEVARRSGISARMLRHYDRIGLVSPSGRTTGGYREYSDHDVRLLFRVEGLRSLGLSLGDVADVLGDLSFDPAPMIEQIIAATRERIDRDEELLRRLTRVHTSNPAGWTEVLSTIGLMRGLESNDANARQRLVLALTAVSAADAGSLAEAALSERDTNVAGALYWALARTGDDAVPVLVAALDAGEPERRHHAVLALEKIGSHAALAALGGFVRHSDPFVSGRATLARGSVGSVDAVPELVELVAEGRDDVQAADILGELARSAENPESIIRQLTTRIAGAPAAARQRLAAAIAEVPGRAASDVLTGLLDDPDRGVVLTATFLLSGRDT